MRDDGRESAGAGIGDLQKKKTKKRRTVFFSFFFVGETTAETVII